MKNNELDKLRIDIKQRKKNLAKLYKQRDKHMKGLKRDFDCDTLEEAEKKLAELETMINQLKD